MIPFVARRLAASALLLLVVLTATFALLQLKDGDPVLTMTAASSRPLSSAFVARERERLGLDRPLPEQYLRWLRGAVIDGDWGQSYQGGPAMAPLIRALPNTVWLTLAVLLIQHGVGLSLGILAAVHHNRAADHVIRGLALLFFALPVFWLGHLAIELFGVQLKWFPIKGMRAPDSDSLAFGARWLDRAQHLILPASTLALTGAASVIRLVRNSMIEVLAEDYIRAARARGLGRARVLWLYALPNTLGPVIQRLGVNLPALLSGAFIVESIFGWPRRWSGDVWRVESPRLSHDPGRHRAFGRPGRRRNLPGRRAARVARPSDPRRPCGLRSCDPGSRASRCRRGYSPCSRWPPWPRRGWRRSIPTP